MAWLWTLKEDACTGCGICADICAHGAIHMPPEDAYPAGIEDCCTGCMDCVEECPFDAIVVWQRTSGMETGTPL